MRIAYALSAAVAASLFVTLGLDVTRSGEPASFVAMERTLLGQGALVAWWLTWTCYPYVLAPLAVALLAIAWRVPAWRTRILFSIVMLLLCWRGADLAQHYFMRPRRLDWLVKHEGAFSYPSSHAAIATGFYALWAAMLYTSDLPRRACTVAAACLLLLAIAICWARLALGAHYLTDLVGGALLAAALVAAGIAVLPVKVFASAEART
ncbi:MAG: phosphatase PAP2 family protein [Candidatus Tumulicola sp.]